MKVFILTVVLKLVPSLAASASSGNLFKMQISRHLPRPETLSPEIWVFQALQADSDNRLSVRTTVCTHFFLFSVHPSSHETPSSLASVLDFFLRLGLAPFIFLICILPQGDRAHSLALNSMTSKVVCATHTCKFQISLDPAVYLVFPSECLLNIPLSLKKILMLLLNLSFPVSLPQASLSQ